MPRVGRTPVKADRADNPDGEMSPYAGLHEYQRDQAIVTATAMLDRIQRTQATTRNKKGRLRRARFVSAVLSLRHEGFTPKQTAELLGVSPQQVTYALTQIRKDAKVDEQVARLDTIAVPLAVDNVMRGIMEGDKEYTLRLMDGRGLFRSHQSIKGELKAEIVQLSVLLQMPAHLIGKDLPLPRAGSILGAPTIVSGMPSAKLLEGVVVSQTPAIPVHATPALGEAEIKE